MQNQNTQNSQRRRRKHNNSKIFLLTIALLVIILSIIGIKSIFSTNNSKTQLTYKDKEKCQYVGDMTQKLIKDKGYKIFENDSIELAKILATGFKKAETTGNMISVKNKFTAFISKNGECSYEQKNCSLNVGMLQPEDKCVFFFDNKNGMQASDATLQFLQTKQ